MSSVAVEAGKIAVITVVAALVIPVAIVWLLSTAWCLAWGHLGRIICDCGEPNGR